MSKLTMNRFANDDISSVCRISIEEAGKCAIPEAQTHESFAHLNVCYGEFKGSLLRDKASENTTKARAADKRRDDAAVGLFVSLDGMLYSPTAAKRAKAEVLSGRLAKFRGIQELPDTKESSQVISLIALLGEPENAQLVKELALDEYVVELKAAAAEFDALWSNRETDVAAFRNSLAATTLRRKVEVSVNRYYEYVLFNAEFSGKPEWRQLQQEIYSRYLTIRQKYSAAKKDEKKDEKKDTK
ncbi:DUF6261 family protein [uncultured Acetobacteroides sp.]|uniref:DUF6261 family protein n=1 Tax=uncultured Acetobacteroides sp. TaxID=1760811 RepID=UPI0029F53637|nr:DUF6261 family protein [uncultured Acetobacteroides sp.]